MRLFPDFKGGGKAFYVVGLHPGSARKGRQLSTAAIVFNLYSQFGVLQKSGKFERIRETILKRDTALNGSENKMLAENAGMSEARQYSGRQVDKAWKCPFHALKNIIS